jgi:hypothetical protein
MLFDKILTVFDFVCPYELLESGLDTEAGYIYFVTRNPLHPAALMVLLKDGWNEWGDNKYVLF